MPPHAWSRTVAEHQAVSSKQTRRGTKLFVYSFLLVFVFCGFKRIELWPLTGWKLFSAVRTDEQHSFRANYVDGVGKEGPIPFGQLSWAYRGHVHVLKDLSHLSDPQRLAVCDAWAEAVRDTGKTVLAIKIYETKWRLSERSSLRAIPPESRLRFTCAAGHLTESP